MMEKIEPEAEIEEIIINIISRVVVDLVCYKQHFCYVFEVGPKICPFAGNFPQNDRNYQGGRDGNPTRNDNFSDSRNSNRGTFGQFSSDRRNMNSGPGGGGNNGNFPGGSNNNYNNDGNRMPAFFAQKTQRQAQDRTRRQYDDFPEVPSSSGA